MYTVNNLFIIQYGQNKKIKKILERQGWIVSRHRIDRIMEGIGLISKYIVTEYKPSKTTCNEPEVGSVLNHEFNQVQELKVIVNMKKTLANFLPVPIV